MMSKIEELLAGVEEQKKSRDAATEGTIKDIEVGKVGDWIPKDKLERPESADKDALQLHIEVPDNYVIKKVMTCLLYTSPSPRDRQRSRMPSSA